jgi:hypothetical protein
VFHDIPWYHLYAPSTLATLDCVRSAPVPAIMAQGLAPLVPGRDDKPFQHSQPTAGHAAMIQSRETGDVLPEDSVKGNVKALPFAKSWVHLFAGG